MDRWQIKLKYFDVFRLALMLYEKSLDDELKKNDRYFVQGKVFERYARHTKYLRDLKQIVYDT